MVRRRLLGSTSCALSWPAGGRQQQHARRSGPLSCASRCRASSSCCGAASVPGGWLWESRLTRRQALPWLSNTTAASCWPPAGKAGPSGLRCAAAWASGMLAACWPRLCKPGGRLPSRQSAGGLIVCDWLCLLSFETDLTSADKLPTLGPQLLPTLIAPSFHPAGERRMPLTSAACSAATAPPCAHGAMQQRPGDTCAPRAPTPRLCWSAACWAGYWRAGGGQPWPASCATLWRWCASCRALLSASARSCSTRLSRRVGGWNVLWSVGGPGFWLLGQADEVVCMHICVPLQTS